MEPVYDVGSSYDGTEGQIIASPQTIGQNVFVCDSKSGKVIKSTVSADIHRKMGVIELPRDWIGRRVLIRPFVIFSV